MTNSSMFENAGSMRGRSEANIHTHIDSVRCTVYVKYVHNK